MVLVYFFLKSVFIGKVKIKWYLNAKSSPVDQRYVVIKGRKTSEGLSPLSGQFA